MSYTSELYEIVDNAIIITKKLSSDMFEQVEETDLLPFNKVICTLTILEILRRNTLDSLYSSLDKLDSNEISALIFQINDLVDTIMTQK